MRFDLANYRRWVPAVGQWFSAAQWIMDATFPQSVKMKQKFVKGANCADPHNCALAVALRADAAVLDAFILPGKAFVIYRSDPSTVIRYDLGDTLKKVIRGFDVPGKGQKGTLFPSGWYTLQVPRTKLGTRKGIEVYSYGTGCTPVNPRMV